MNHLLRISLTTLMALSLVACSDSVEEADDKKATVSAEELYLKARKEFDEGSYKAAVKSFDEVERQHPASEWADDSQIMSAYASYEQEDYEGAIAAFERYVRFFPNQPSTPYAYYMIALSYYEQISDVGRDQKITEQALQALRDVVRRFPETDYARDAKIKLDLTLDHLSGKEMNVGRYYLVRDDYLAAINRFRYVVENYQTTSHVPEALHRLVEGYLKLGVQDEAKKYAAVLGHNFPSSLWYRDSYRLLKGDLPSVVKPEEQETEEESPSSWWEF